jgi:nucleotide sugar dehydrogenase
VTELQLAVNGREDQLLGRLTAFSPEPSSGEPAVGHDKRRPAVGTVAIVGLGYVGLPTALALAANGAPVVGLDSSAARLSKIAEGDVDLCAADERRLGQLLTTDRLVLTADVDVLAQADAVVICVPTPVDEGHTPETSALHEACATVVAHACRGQTIILTSTSSVGTTRELLVEPLADRGLAAGTDVAAAFSPERIDPGNPTHEQAATPRVVGGATPSCGQRAGAVIRAMTESVYLVSSPEAAELTKLYENIFRAVTLSLANEFADVCGSLGVDPTEVTLAAGTKPYGFLATLPGPGVGGHCIPCDPYYLLSRLAQDGTPAPLISQAMRSIEARPARVGQRAGEVLGAAGKTLAGARVLVVGVSYKANVRDIRNSSAVPLIENLRAAGAQVGYHDPLVSELTLSDGNVLAHEPTPRGGDWDLAITHTVHDGHNYSWVAETPLVLDATYRFEGAEQSVLV